ncbi:hypothetical protein [Cesiribacter sp. SM1]|uniref:hypothetical protein n=1 Tax=Cesiribacter sp. SM1 TaxID=2861196 RepID=UPI001CD42FE0|nr:hypothetical protein [Cesiribacter sp. SM1]
MARKPEKQDKNDKPSKKEAPKVNDELNGFDIKIDTFGEIRSTMSIDDINKFLNKNVDDKKLRDRDDLEFIQDKKNKKIPKKIPKDNQSDE